MSFLFALGAADTFEHIESQTASDDSSIDFTNVFASDDAFDRYVVFGDNIIPATDGERLFMRVSSDGGSNWDSGSSDYARALFQFHRGGSTGANGSAGDSEIRLVNRAGGSASNNDTANFVTFLSEPTDGNRASIERSMHVNRVNSQSNPHRAEMAGGIRLTQSSVDSIRLIMSSGNISSGLFSVYGVSE